MRAHEPVTAAPGSAGHSARARTIAAALAVGIVVACGLAVALGAAAAPSFLIYGNPSIPPVPPWLRTPLAGVGAAPGEDVFSALVLAMFGGYLVVVRLAGALRPSVVVGAIAALHLALLLAPPILSGDAFSYLAYARLLVLYGLSPYRHAAEDAPGDVLLPFVGIPGMESPYGPLFTLLTLALVPLGPAGGMWSVKALAVGAGLGCATLVWSSARALGRPPGPAMAFVALNPLFLLYAVGGAHNDMAMAVLVLAGIRLTLGAGPRAEAAGIAGLATAAAVKATAGLVLPFAVLGARRRLRALVVALAAGAGLASLSLLVFGSAMADYLEVLARQGRSVSIYSIWLDLARLAGYETVPPAMRLVLASSFVAALGAALWRTHRGGDWIAGAGWATLALLFLTTWLLPWYVVLLLPLAALGSSGALRTATLAFCALLLVTRLPLLLA